MDALANTVHSINRLQEVASKLPQAELKTDHYFVDGMYCRVLFRPADTLIIGKVHKREHLYIVCSGTVRVANKDGTKDITGPAVIISKPGTKRAVWSLTDATCLTVHRTDKTDLDEIEKELIEDDPDAMYDAYNHLKLDQKVLP